MQGFYGIVYNIWRVALRFIGSYAPPRPLALGAYAVPSGHGAKVDKTVTDCFVYFSERGTGLSKILTLGEFCVPESQWSGWCKAVT